MKTKTKTSAWRRFGDYLSQFRLFSFLRRDNKPKTRRRYLRVRYVVISLLILAVSVVCMGFLLNTTVVLRDKWVAKGDSTLSDTMIIKPLRGEILAADGSILATNLNYYNVRIDFHASRINEIEYLASLDSLADTLAVYYPRRTRQEWHDYLDRPMDKPKADRSRCYMLLKHVPYDEVERAKNFPFFRRSKNRNRTGFSTERVLLRRYPYGDMATLSIGRVGETKDCREVHGISGLERALDSLLYGETGYAKKVMFSRGTSYWPVKAQKNGTTITTTIDITIQDLLEHELGQMLLKCKAEWGSAMIMEVATGDIKAISNLDRDTVGGRGYIESMNHIVQAYEPGSVIKVVSMLTALEDGYAHLNQVFPIGRSFPYAKGRPISDTHSPAYLPVSRFIEYSSNIGMTKLIAPHYSDDNLNGFRERLREIGFFDPLHTGMANERPPYYPTLDPKAGGRVSLSRMIFGYATQVPPLYTCAIYNAIANDGKFVRPRLVKALRRPDGTDSAIDVSYVRDSICSPRNAAILREMMRSVVWGEGGTAKGLQNKIVEIAGKTGTAGIALERPRGKDGKIDKSKPFKGGYREGKHNRVAFCGFFPYDKPKYTCIVVISDPQGPYGPAATSGTVLCNLALKLYSRGMLDNSTDFREEPGEPTPPTFYGTERNDRASILHRDLGISRSSILHTERAKPSAQTIPDVRGLGVREALVKLEELGLRVHFSGTGYVTALNPPAGTPFVPGAKVYATLSQD